jgi:predicted amidohydrolase
MDYTVSLAQIHPKLGCVADNLVQIEAAVERGIQEGAKLVVFPELSLTGYFLRDLVPEVALSLKSPEVEKLKILSRSIAIALGFVEVAPGYQFYNAGLFLEGGQIRHLHRKVYLPTYGLFDEQRYFAKGWQFRAFDTELGRMGLLICEDMLHPSAPYILALDGATTILCLASSPGRGITEAPLPASATAWHTQLCASAMSSSCWCLFCNRVGVEDGIAFWGGSEAISPSGASLTQGKLFDEDFVLARLEEATLRRERIHFPVLRDESVPITLRELQRIEWRKERPCHDRQ